MDGHGGQDNQAKTFLDALFGGVPPELRILLWTLPDKRSYWPEDVEKASRLIEGLVEGHDVYVGVGLSPQPFGPQQRCKASDVAGIVGLWADVDIAGPGHKKQNLPPDAAAAAALLEKLPLEPTLVVSSGGGLQAWWLFHEPWIFAGEEDRARAARLAQDWLRSLKVHAEAQKWDVDATHDLARVLRVPGTLNQKTQPPRPVAIERIRPELRYEPDDFEQYVASSSPAMAPPIVIGPLKVDAAAQPPLGRLMKLFNDEPLALASFSHKNPGLADQSPSSYDFSIANYMVRGGFGDQEIVDTLIASRREAGCEPKLRLDYYQRTLGKVRGDVQRGQLQAQASEFFNTYDADTDGTLAQSDQGREEVLKHLSVTIGTRIVRIVKFKKDPPEFMLQTERGEIDLGEVAGLTSQGKLRNAVAAIQGHFMPEFKAKEWRAIAQWLLNACEEHDVGPEGTDRGILRGWIINYLEKYPPGEFDEGALSGRQPFIREGVAHVFGDHFRTFLLRKYGEKVSAKEMGRLMRKCGCKNRVVEIDQGSNRVGRMVWLIPTDESGQPLIGKIESSNGEPRKTL
jgi:hypothetical protein